MISIVEREKEELILILIITINYQIVTLDVNNVQGMAMLVSLIVQFV